MSNYRKPHNRCIVVGIFFLLHVAFSGAAQILFYEHAHAQGASLTVTKSARGCHNFPAEWNDRISSVNTQDNCIIVFEHGSCQGRSERIAPGTPSHGNLVEINFNDMMSSFDLCSGSGGQEPNPSNPPNQPGNEVWRAAADEHNKYRRRHGVPFLSADDAEIHRTAQQYAEYLAANDKFEHSGNPKYGENLAGSGGSNQVEAVRDSIRRWYNEESKYDYNQPGYKPETGHFTAVVWKSTTHVGIGVAWNPKKNWWVVVANYGPPGNFLGQFAENVFRPVAY